MSRHAFFEIITNCNEIINKSRDTTLPPMKDTKDNSFEQWGDYGVVGWDESQNTYFINIETDAEESSWMLGRYPNEIPTFNSLCDVINNIFSVTDGTFIFNDTIEVTQKIKEHKSKPSVKKPDANTTELQVDYYHQYGKFSGNIMWPKSLGQNKATHPVHSTEDNKHAPIVLFREKGYFASCFPEGDGITMMDNSNKKSPEEVIDDIKICFGWDAVLKNKDRLLSM
jgi:hypothetical protein